MCSGVCSAVLLSAENKLTWLGKHRSFLALPPLQLSPKITELLEVSSPAFCSEQLAQGSVQLISTMSTRTEIHNLSGSLFKYLTTLARLPLCPLGILISISHISSCAHHFPGHPKKSLYVSTPSCQGAKNPLSLLQAEQAQLSHFSSCTIGFSP